uniref:Uncharacterized protein n=1 Tax=Mycena chlorophos TaxID=658473 RepID=A0ABQ0LZY2_MYCCL|nr:predicted protein [Mycena chlorophos]
MSRDRPPGPPDTNPLEKFRSQALKSISRHYSSAPSATRPPPSLLPGASGSSNRLISRRVRQRYAIYTFLDRATSHLAAGFQPSTAQAQVPSIPRPAEGSFHQTSHGGSPTNPPRRRALHPHWCVRAIMYLVVFLHARFHVTFRACDLILKCTNIIFRGLMIVSDNSPMPTTLRTVFSQLGVVDDFQVYPICFNCHYIRQGSSVVGGRDRNDQFCPNCNVDMFGPPPPLVEESDDEDAPLLSSSASAPSAVPYMVAPLQNLSASIRQLFQRPGMVAAMNSWKTSPSIPGELNSMYVARAWREVPAPGDPTESFFFGPTAQNEIRIGVTFSLDWFGRSTSAYSPNHSSGIGSFSIQNFEPTDRFRADNLIPGFMTPGPTEPTGSQLQNYLALVVDDLLDLYQNGIVVYTREYPDGIRVRVALVAIIADHPAMCKVGYVGSDFDDSEMPELV